MAYIEKEPIIKFITKGLNNPDKTKAFGYDAIEILTEIEYSPTADVVPRAEIAEEIFAEIEEAINNLEYTAKSPTKTVILEKMTEVVNWVLHEVVPNRIAELKKKYMMREISNEEKCLVCGKAIPEGRQVCPNCEEGGDN